MTFCPSGKAPHSSKSAAAFIIAKYRLSSTHAYRCPDCDEWHLTRDPPQPYPGNVVLEDEDP